MVDEAGVLVRTLDSGTSAVCNAGAISCGTFTWDGTYEHGAAVVDGSYTVHVTVTDASQQSATLDIPITLDRRVPGTITQPSSGGVVSGVATLRVHADGGVRGNQVGVVFRLSVGWGRCRRRMPMGCGG